MTRVECSLAIFVSRHCREHMCGDEKSSGGGGGGKARETVLKEATDLKLGGLVQGTGRGGRQR